MIAPQGLEIGEKLVWKYEKTVTRPNQVYWTILEAMFMELFI